jgi:dinuclear metal center YbgI/SA1388 family protein
MLLRDVLAALDRIAPLRHAESWDNVGLIAGDPTSEITRALLTIDCTAAVADEAARERCELVVAYHPPLFEAVKSVSATSLIHRAIRHGIALYSPHTALDVAQGGTNDLLADVLGMAERAPLKLVHARETSCKLVTFVPEADLERVSTALFDAGAGVIGQYSECSFRSAGTGTFRGGEGTSPAVGRPGRPERAPEVRIETIVPLSRQEAVIEALRAAHPYEEPAFDLIRLVARPEGAGIGRAGKLASPAPRAELIERVKQGLGVSAVLVAGPTEGDVTRVAVCAGAGRGLLNEALARKTELFLTGELPHHDALRAAAAGMTVVCALHSNSERAALPRLKSRLEAEVPGLTVLISEADRDPFVLR